MSLWTTTPKGQQSRFLTKLPAELRAHIYAFALTSSVPTVTFTLDAYQRQSYTEATQPPLTRVSRQVRAESLPVFYASNTFVLHTEGDKADDARRWLVCNAAWLQEARRIEFWLRYVTLPAAMAAVRGLQGAMGGIGVTLARRVKGAAWEADGWRWITVVRKPDEANEDGDYLVQKVGTLVSGIGNEGAGAEEYMALGKGLRAVYVEHKTRPESLA